MDKNVVFVFIGTLIVLFLVMVVLRNHTVKQMNDAMVKKDYKALEKAVNSFTGKYFFDKFTRNFMLLDANMMQLKTKEVGELMDYMLTLKLTLAQQQEMLGKCFYYFLSLNEKTWTKKTLEYIRKVKNEAMLKDCELFYDVLILKQSNHKEETLELLEKADAHSRPTLQYLAGMQYCYDKEYEKGNQYLEEALKSLKGTPYEEQIKTIMAKVNK